MPKKRKKWKCPKCNTVLEDVEVKDIEKHLEMHEKEISIRGFKLKVGDCLKVVYGRFALYVEVIGLTENPYIIRCRDIYDHETMINLSKTFLVSKITREEYEQKKRKKRGGK